MKSATVPEKVTLGRVMPKTLGNEMLEALEDFARAFEGLHFPPNTAHKRSVTPDLWQIELRVSNVRPVEGGLYATLQANGLGYLGEQWKLERVYAFKRNADHTYSLQDK